MNITVKVLVAQALAAMARLKGGVNSLNFSGATAGAGAFGGALNGMRIDRFGSQMQWLGRQIEYNFTLPLALAGAAVFKMAMDNEKALTRVKKVYGDAGHDANFYKLEIQSLEKAFIALSNQFGIAQADAINIAADWAAAGASGLALAKSVQLTMKTMVLGEMEAADATKALISIQAQYGLSIDELTKTINILNMVENQTGTSMKDLVDGFSRAAGVARSMGVTTQELAADIAALTPATGSAANAGNALKTIFSRLMSQTKDMASVMHEMGIEVNSFGWQSSTAQEKLMIMAHAFEGLSSAQQGFVSSIIASRYQVNRFEVLMAELVSGHGYYQKALDATSDSTAVFQQAQKELNAVLTSSPQRLKIVWTTMQNAATDIIQPMIPLILWLAEAIQKLVTSFSNLNPSIQKFILFGLAMIAIVGPLIRYLGAFQILFFELAGVFRLLLGPIGAVTGALWMFIKLPFAAVLSGMGIQLAGFNTGFWKFAKLPFTAVLGLWGMAVRGFLTTFFALPRLVALAVTGVTRVFTFAAGIWARISLWYWTQVQAAAFMGFNTLRYIWMVGTTRLGTLTTIIMSRIAGVWRLVMGVIAQISTQGWGYIRTLWAIGMMVLNPLMAGFLVAMSFMWSAGTAALAQIAAALWPMLLGIFRAGGTALIAVQNALWRAQWAIWAAGNATLAVIQAVWGRVVAAIAAVHWNGLRFYASQLWTGVMPKIWAAGNAALAVIQAVWGRTLALIAAVHWNGLRATAAQIWTAVMPKIWAAGNAALVAIQTVWGRAVALVAAVHWNGIRTYAGQLWQSLSGLFAAGYARLRALTVAFAISSSGIWAAFVAGAASPIALTRKLFMGIRALFIAFIPTMRALSTAVMAAATGPIGIAVSAIAVLIIIFWKQIKQVFANAVGWFTGNGKGIAKAFDPIGKAAQSVRNMVLKAFNALPNGIQNAMLAVVRTIAAAAKAVYNWMSYINPWARHSPSLVDNVTSGVAAIQTEFTSLNSIGNTFGGVLDNLEKFRQATAAVNRSAEANNYAAIRADLLALASDAVPAFDALIKELYGLEDQLKAVEAAMSAQQAVVDALKGKLDDANSALDTQTNILQKMKDEADSYSDVINRINGDLEVLTGTREALRQAGAGSDILGPMDEQIKNLQGQKKGINDQLDAAKKAYNDQKKLVDDLTAARDKLKASYDEEQKKLDEIEKAYGKIKDRISDITNAIQDFSSSVQTLDQAKGASNGIADQFAAGAGANFADPGGAGGLGREGGIPDQSAEIDKFTKQLQDETKNMFGMFNFMDPLKKAWNTSWEWIKTTFGPLGSMIGDFISHLFDNVSNPFAGGAMEGGFKSFTEGIKSIMEGLKGFVEAAWRLIGPPLQELWKVIKESLAGAMEKLEPAFAKLKELMGPLQKLWEALVPILKVLAAIVGGVLLLAFVLIVDILKNVFGPVIDMIVGILDGLIKIIVGVVKVIIGIFTGDLGMIVDGVKDIFWGLVNGIWSIIKNLALIIWGIVKGIVEGIVDFFTWLWDELVGHSIIPDIVNGITEWFNKMVAIIKVIMDALGAVIMWVWENMIKPVFEVIAAVWGWVVDKIKEGVEKWKERFEIAKQVLVILRDKFKEVVDNIKDKFWEIVDKIKDAVENVKGKIEDFVTKILGIRERIRNAFDGIFDGLKNAFKSALNWIIGKWNDMSFGVGPFKAETPDMPFLAAGGKTTGPAVVGEGRPGHPEYVIPTDPQYRKRAWMLMEQLAGDLGVSNLLGSGGTMRQFAHALSRGVAGDKIQFFASGGVIGGGRLRGSMRGGLVVVSQQETKTYHFHGDLSFPNVKSGEDAETFIRNLEALLDEG